ncbi:MAG: hypothetical protein OJF48_001601 [Afipia sp.]|nr:MAG: hypothetical protein OJF48_001601 [Afipia sp.]
MSRFSALNVYFCGSAQLTDSAGNKPFGGVFASLALSE